MSHHNGKYAKKPFWTLKRRRVAYGVVVAVGAAAVTFGLIEEPKMESLVLIFAALLGTTGLAVSHPTKDEEAVE